MSPICTHFMMEDHYLSCPPSPLPMALTLLESVPHVNYELGLPGVAPTLPTS